MKGRLHNLIFLGMFVGLVVGMMLWAVDDKSGPLFADTMWWLDLLGATLFMSALKMIIAPLILASIVAGVTSLPNMRELGAIGWKTVAYYATTTTLAVLVGLVLVLTLQPGKKPAAEAVREARAQELVELAERFEAETGTSAKGADGVVTAQYLEFLDQLAGTAAASGSEARRYGKLAGARGRTAGDIFKDDIVKPLLDNPFHALAKSPPNSLGIIFFSLLLGIACTVVGEQAAPVVRFFTGLNAVMMKITHWLMAISPFAIACIVASLVAKHGPEVFQTLGWYCITVIAGIAIHVTILVLIARFVGKISPVDLFRGIREAWMIAFSTRSSAATLPVTIANTIEKLGVSPKIANFSLPLGATMNMDGTALYEGIAVIFLIQVYGGLDDVMIPMTLMTTILIFITAVLASVGAAAVPDAGLVTMVLVASAVNLPIYYIPLIFAVDAFLDMFRTSTNILGDTVGAVVVNRLEAESLA